MFDFLTIPQKNILSLFMLDPMRRGKVIDSYGQAPDSGPESSNTKYSARFVFTVFINIIGFCEPMHTDHLCLKSEIILSFIFIII